ncbi:MAG TPA: DUF6438 domain-containing protein [Flavobacteriales bacterium]|nr:DUF6438 domain-containing protein [Flavobacteriales bacterium]
MIQRSIVHLTALLLIPFALACKNKQPATTDTTVSTPPVVEEGLPRFGGVAPSDSLFFMLQRTPCFGACPVYAIKVYRSGFATYDARANVELTGQYTGHVKPEMMEDLLAKTEAYGFFSMNDKYDGQVTDLPSTIIQVATNGRMKKVVSRVGTPATFKSFAEYAERALMPLKWSPVPAKP